MKRLVLLIVAALLVFSCAAVMAEENTTIVFDAESYLIPVGKNVNIK